jgi:hypothetical protein
MHTQLVPHAPFAAPGLDGMRFLPASEIAKCQTYRDAVLLGWENRSRQNMTQSTLGELCGLYAPHVSSYLNRNPLDRQGKKRLDLPPACIADFNLAVGNYAVAQYLNRLGKLTIMEELISQRIA